MDIRYSISSRSSWAVLFMGGLFFLSIQNAKAQNCVTSLNNAVGDQITVTGLLTTTDPNENGEGEPALFSSSAGDFSAVDNDYFLAQTYTYTATQANESISGTNQGFDYDESCSVSAIITAQSLKFGFLTQGDRNALQKAAQAGVIVAGSGAVVTELCTAGVITAPICSLPVGIGTAITGLGSVLLDTIATDPSDPDFTVIAQPVIVSLPPVVPNSVLTQAEADAFNALFTSEATTIAYEQVVITSFNRAQGAFDAGNAYWQAQQLQAASKYLGQLVSSLSAEPGLRTTLSNLLSADPNFASFSLSPSQAFTGESILASSLPPSIMQALVTLGADSTTITNVQDALFVQDINAVSGNVVLKIADPNLLGALNALVNALGITVQIDIKPGDNTTSAVINSGSRGTIPVAILSTSTFNATTQVDTSSLTFGLKGNENSLAFCNKGGEDVNGDGLPDLVCHFQTQKAGFQPGATTATLLGRTINNVPIRGTESISVVP